MAAAALVVALGFALVLAFRSVGALSRRVESLESMVRQLTGRIYDLESGAHPAQAPIRETAPEPVARQPVSVSPQPVSSDTSRDWEATIGGNWLNKVGVFVLVVGIALFLGYSLTHLGAAGKIAIGYAAGIAMLTSGVVLEWRETYRSFSWGLTGGGWAAVFFTTYAMHALPAAQLISDPVAATAMLLAVSIGMIGHSFTYRSQVVSAVAYFAAFASFNLTALTNFSPIAAILVAAAAVVTAVRFNWYGLAAIGAVLSYATFLLRYHFTGESILWVYWILFETCDLIALRRGESSRYFWRLAAVNAAGFTAASMFHSEYGKQWEALFTTAALAYAASILARVWLNGRYELSVTLAAVFTSGAIMQHFSGLGVTFWLLVEGELIVIAALFLRQRFLKLLGAAVFVAPFVHLLVLQATDETAIRALGRTWRESTPTALLAAAVFYLNRGLRAGTWPYTLAGSVLVTAAVGIEFDKQWIAPAWAALAVAGLLFSARRGAREFTIQAHAGFVLAFGAALSWSLDGRNARTRIVATAIVAAALYTWEFFSAGVIRVLAPVMGSLLLTILLASEVDGGLLTVAWGAEGIGLLAAGFSTRERVLRLCGLALFVLCIAKLFFYDMRALDTLSRILSFIVLGLMMLGASWVYTRFREQIRRLL